MERDKAGDPHEIFYFRQEEVDLTIYEPVKDTKPIKDKRTGAMVFPYYRRLEQSWNTVTGWRARKYDE